MAMVRWLENRVAGRQTWRRDDEIGAQQDASLRRGVQHRTGACDPRSAAGCTPDERVLALKDGFRPRLSAAAYNERADHERLADIVTGALRGAPSLCSEHAGHQPGSGGRCSRPPRQTAPMPTSPAIHTCT